MPEALLGPLEVLEEAQFPVRIGKAIHFQREGPLGGRPIRFEAANPGAGFIDETGVRRQRDSGWFPDNLLCAARGLRSR